MTKQEYEKKFERKLADKQLTRSRKQCRQFKQASQKRSK